MKIWVNFKWQYLGGKIMPLLQNQMIEEPMPPAAAEVVTVVKIGEEAFASL